MDSAKRPETVTVKVIPMPEGQSEINSDVLAQLDATETVDMTQSYTIPGCEPLFSTPVNKAVKLESPQYGTLVGKVISSSEPVLMKQVAIFKKSAIASKETFSSFYSQANLVSSRSNGKYENFKTVCDTMGLYIHPANRISRNNEKFGVVDNAREVTNWAYGVKKTGSVSEIKVPETNVLTVLCDKDGRIFVGMDNPRRMGELVQGMADQYGVQLTKKQFETAQGAATIVSVCRILQLLLDRKID